jgi:hypothetical protein
MMSVDGALDAADSVVCELLAADVVELLLRGDDDDGIVHWLDMAIAHWAVERDKMRQQLLFDACPPTIH